MIQQKKESQDNTLDVTSHLVVRGIAQFEAAKLICLPKGFASLSELQRRMRNRLPPKSVSGTEKNISWKGTSIIKLAEILTRQIAKGRDIHKTPTIIEIYKEFREHCAQATIGQVANAVKRIFKNVSTEKEVWDCANNHHSYGDAWRALSIEDRARVKAARVETLQKFWSQMSLEERKSRKAQVRDAQIKHLPAEVSREIFKTSRDLKDLEERNLPGQAFKFTGVLEKMRSSWEALYARSLLTQADRHYFYEPMGFPIIIPGSGRVSAYHPDFFDFKFRNDGREQGRIIEIKGYLTETGRDKIAAFRKFYIVNDFSGLSPEEAALMKRFVEENKRLALKQFGLRITKKTQFRIYGDSEWDYKNEKFFAPEPNGSKGLIPRLRERFPELLFESPEGGLSRKKAQEIADKICPGERLKNVQPSSGKSFIQRSEYFHVDIGFHVNLYIRSRIFSAAMTRAYIDAIEAIPIATDLLPLFPAMPVLCNILSRWNASSDKEKEDIFNEVELCAKATQTFHLKHGINFLLVGLTGILADLSNHEQGQLTINEPYYRAMNKNILELISRFTAIQKKALEYQYSRGLMHELREEEEIHNEIEKATRDHYSRYYGYKDLGALGIDVDFILNQFKNPTGGVISEALLLRNPGDSPPKFAYDLSLKSLSGIALEAIYPVSDIPDLRAGLRKLSDRIDPGTFETTYDELERRAAIESRLDKSF